MAVHCGDCGQEMVVLRGRCYCPLCSPPPRVGKPKAVKLEPSVYTGGGIEGACHRCGCAEEECECEHPA